MEFTGKMLNVSKDWKSRQWNITFSINEPSAIEEIEHIQDCEKLNIKAVKFRQKRSLDANALLWVCLGQIAATLRTDKWDIYLQMLKRYGKYTYICVKPSVVDAVKTQWRECEEIGVIDINGDKAVQMLCYFGSSTYNTKEFSVLLDGVISEMKEMNLPAPTSEEMRRSLEQWEKQHQ
ncbi:hypothetical protein [Bacillus infantis]|uniref:hypothetical protein n=1 Tax=Bacillus infantis TaxID=324767 RepID=UPI003CF628D5